MRPHQNNVKDVKNALWQPDLVGRTPDRSVVQWWGGRSYRGQPGSTRVKLLRNAVWQPNLKEPLTKVKSNNGVEGHAGVSWGQTGVKLLRNALWLPNFIGRTPDRKIIHWWVQTSGGVSWGQPEVKLHTWLITTKCGQCRFTAYDLGALAHVNTFSLQVMLNCKHKSPFQNTNLTAISEWSWHLAMNFCSHDLGYCS